MLNLKILDYRITSDSNQVIVHKARRNESGDIVLFEDKEGVLSESLTLVGYWNTLIKALRGVQNDYVLSHSNKPQITTIKDYIKEIEYITNETSRVLEDMSNG